ncbi:nuclear transport factor 2 family protein [Pelagibaculum spongiae]|uniref:Nuclear transport factor 2 family protein n=1 Tax=Pelagibaculum spongiae TaxID=2080658 RepID=A0A2V1H387_9GAMM|nr:nuclear transport factor 2 family protein [Pelagibaculum spongiae]PVZ71637.1 nuclear transport factor 2 family protein [Pelagibaculum spongiae]
MTQNITENQATQLIASLYQAVDRLDAKSVGQFLTRNARFQLGNHGAISGKEQIINANAAFFQSINTMRHTILNIWQQNNNIICAGKVHYTRHDSSTLEIPFSGIFKLESGLINDYQIYVDISPL